MLRHYLFVRVYLRKSIGIVRHLVLDRLQRKTRHMFSFLMYNDKLLRHCTSSNKEFSLNYFYGFIFICRLVHRRLYTDRISVYHCIEHGSQEIV
jgi:hypothetical protein